MNLLEQLSQIATAFENEGNITAGQILTEAMNRIAKLNQPVQPSQPAEYNTDAWRRYDAAMHSMGLSSDYSTRLILIKGLNEAGLRQLPRATRTLASWSFEPSLSNTTARNYVRGWAEGQNNTLQIDISTSDYNKFKKYFTFDLLEPPNVDSEDYENTEE